MKSLLSLLASTLIAFALNAANPSEQDVTSIVEQTATDVTSDAQGTFMKIFRGESPYASRENPDLFAYVLTLEGKIEVHPRVSPTGRKVMAQADAKGVKYYSEIITKSQETPESATGWMSYFLLAPDGSTSERKIYYHLVTGSNSKKYIICSERRPE